MSEVPGARRFGAGEVSRVLFSVVFAVGLWVFVADEESTEILATASIELRNIPTGFEVVTQSAQSVDIRLRGSSSLLRDAPLDDLRAWVDLSGELPGERTWFLDAASVEAPSGVEVMRVQPSEVELQLDRTVSRTIRVSPRILGEPATGFEIHRIEIEPSELTVEGPESLFEEVEVIFTDPISAEGLREPYAQQLQIELEEALRPSLRQVDVRLVIGEEREARELLFPVRAAPSGDEAPACDVVTSELAATVLVPRSLIEAADAAENGIGFAEVRCEGLEAGVHELVPEAVFEPFAPFAVPGLEVAAFDPAAVTVIVGSAGVPPSF